MELGLPWRDVANMLALGILMLLNVQQISAVDLGLEPVKPTSWDDARAACHRDGYMLLPGRRYKAADIHDLLGEGQAVWLNGWRTLTDNKRDDIGRVITLKVDFSRSSRTYPYICKSGDTFHFGSTHNVPAEEARDSCEALGYNLTSIDTENNFRDILENIAIDQAYWLDAVTTDGTFLKQCLMARKTGDKLQYIYTTCDNKYDFICLKDRTTIESFFTLASKKLVKYQDIEEVINRGRTMTDTSTAMVTSSTPMMPTEMTTTLISPSPMSIEPTVTPTLEPTITPTPSSDFMTSSAITSPPEITSSEVYTSTPSISAYDDLMLSSISPSNVPATEALQVISTQVLPSTSIASSTLTIPDKVDVISDSIETQVDKVVPTSKYQLEYDSESVSPSPEVTSSTPALLSSTSQSVSPSEYYLFPSKLLEGSTLPSSQLSITPTLVVLKTTVSDHIQYTVASVLKASTPTDIDMTSSVYMTTIGSTPTTTQPITTPATESTSTTTEKVTDPTTDSTTTTATDKITKPSTESTTTNTTEKITTPTTERTTTATTEKITTPTTERTTTTTTEKITTPTTERTTTTTTEKITTPTTKRTTTEQTTTDYSPTDDILPSTTGEYQIPYETFTADPDDDDDDDDDVDETIGGDIDPKEDEDENVANETGAENSAPAQEEEEEGWDVGIWVAFVLLLCLVCLSLIVAFILYKKRKSQSKNISNGAAVAPPPADTTELREKTTPSKSPPRESTTFNDKAYDI